MPALLELKNVSSGYGRTTVLHDISIQVEHGEIVALIGANGAGKSTLLHTVMRIAAASAGRIHFNGQPIAARTSAIVRAGIALVPEQRQLFSNMTVAENLRLGAYTQMDRTAIRDQLDAQLAAFPILQERRAQAAHTLSGGEQQMLAIARAMMSKPRLLLLDEPSLGLAPIVTARVFEQVVALRSRGTTILLVEQNSRGALSIADRGYVLEQGRIILTDAASSLLNNSAVQDAYLGSRGATARAIEHRVRARRAMGREQRPDRQ